MRLFDDVASRVDDPYLSHAAALAQRGRGSTSPNPLVGCVVVCDGQIVGEGFHPRAGAPHAEVFALQDAGEHARGADLFVTLEPCVHEGKTPPCTDAIIKAGVRRVFVGMRDPNPQAGGGVEKLREAGITVEVSRDPAPFADLNEGWLKRLATGLPFLTAKVALSLDGHPALERGRRASITGTGGAVATRRLRAQADAVVVGARTVAVDDPALTVRDAHGNLAERQPVRIVLARSTVPPASARVFADGAARTVVVAPQRLDVATLLDAGVDVLQVPEGDRLVDLLGALGGMGLNEVLIEPGSRLLTSLWRERLMDALVTVYAGGMAGCGAPSLYEGTPDEDGDRLLHAMEASESGIVDGVGVTVWRPSAVATRAVE